MQAMYRRPNFRNRVRLLSIEREGIVQIPPPIGCRNCLPLLCRPIRQKAPD